VTTMFVLTLAVQHEGDTLLGVFSSRELADAASETFLVERGRGLYEWERFEVYQVGVDAPAEYHW